MSGGTVVHAATVRCAIVNQQVRVQAIQGSVIGGGGGGAPTTAAYVTLASDGTLSAERVLTAGSNISITDAGAGSTVTVAVTGAALTTNNLSDLANAATARTNLGLGGAATLNVGTTTGTVAAGDHNHSGVYDPAGTAAGLVDDLSGVSNASTARTNLGLGSLATLSTITTSEITDGTITGTDISASAAIALTQLANITTARVLGRTTAGAGAIEELSSVDSFVSAASTTTQGKVELATTAEATAGTDTARAVVATGLAAALSAYNAFAYL